ncbi:MAG TPA: nickel insertion protein, partial [Acetobacteraceae bacterium]|nr:nickel insertion protein [Acetobacteraceae bacterium]
MRHLHLDPVGGIAGDMFVAALLDAAPVAAPAQEAACLAAAEAVAQARCRLLRHGDHVLSGARFTVETDGHDHHPHTAWRDIRARLLAAPLDAAARDHALGIFGHLAAAEGRVHGIDPEAVTFHEVGAVDSIADIVAAAVLIAAQDDGDGPASWSCAPVPLGFGRVETAHGAL